jgi:thiol-disulfide isomerase/thioredoxin
MPMLFLAMCLLFAEPSMSDQVAKMRSDFAALENWFHEELVAAKHDATKVSEANEVYRKKWQKVAEDVIALIKRNPDDPVDGILLVTGDMRWSLDDELTALAIRNKADSRMGRLCFNLLYRGGEPWAESITMAVAQSNPSRDIRAQAIFAQGYQRYSKAFPYGTRLPDEEREPLIKEARKYFTDAAKYIDVMTPDGKTTIGLKATHELNRLDNIPNLKVGGIAPEIAANDLEGKRLKLSDYRGKVVMVVFWGSWCGPCMRMVPQEKALFEKHKGKPFVLLGVNCGDKLDVAKKTVADKKMGWPSWYDGEDIRGPIETDYDVPHWPRIFLIDTKGVIRQIDLEGKELDETVDKLLAEVK